MDKNEFSIARINRLDALLDSKEEFLSTLSSLTTRGSIACHNWKKDFPPGPCSRSVAFSMAFSHRYLYVVWHMASDGLLALNSSDLAPVARDHCVEVFLQVPGQDEYWNFEVNALGALNASHRVSRPHPVRLTAGELAAVKRMGTYVGREPFEVPSTERCVWWVSLAIPWALLGLGGGSLPSYLLGNLYACAGAVENPYYISCFPIDTPRPDFHRPECFGKIKMLQHDEQRN